MDGSCAVRRRRVSRPARNAGVEAATGSLLAFCDQDDVWLPDKLARQVAYLHEHPEVAIVMVRQEPFLDGVDAVAALAPPRSCLRRSRRRPPLHGPRAP